MRYQVTEKIGPMVNGAIEKYAKDEKILWEPALLPGPGGEVVLVCVFWVPGAVLGTVAQGSFMIHDPLNITSTDVEEIVLQFLTEMRKARSGQISGVDPAEAPMGPEADPEPVVRGQQRPSGLYVV